MFLKKIKLFLKAFMCEYMLSKTTECLTCSFKFKPLIYMVISSRKANSYRNNQSQSSDTKHCSIIRCPPFHKVKKTSATPCHYSISELHSGREDPVFERNWPNDFTVFSNHIHHFYYFSMFTTQCLLANNAMENIHMFLCTHKCFSVLPLLCCTYFFHCLYLHLSCLESSPRLLQVVSFARANIFFISLVTGPFMEYKSANSSVN